MSFDKTPRDRGARQIKFGRAVRRLAKQDHARVAVAVEKSSELFGRLGRGQRPRLGAEHFDQFGRRLARDAIIGERLCHELALWWKRAAAMSVRPWSSGRLPSIRSEEHTSELQSLMRISYAVFCLK